MQPNTEEIEGPSHSDIGIATEEVLNEEDLLEIQEEPEEVPRSEPDIDASGCSEWTEGPETPDAEALVVVAGVDIGIFINGEVPTREEVEEVVKRGSKRLPLQFPNDSSNRVFPNTILCYKLPNGEDVHRDWLVWSDYSKDNKWKKLYDRIPEHQESISHKKYYDAWRNFQKVIGCSATISVQLNRSTENEAAIWRALLHRILQVVLFIGERGLAFRGGSQRIGDPNNGNFLGILELIGQYDKILGDHLSKVKESQQSNRRLQVHYLSAKIQNEFIVCCATHVKQAILAQLTATKYYSIIVYGTPDSSHVEQTFSYFGMYTANIIIIIIIIIILYLVNLHQKGK